MTDFARLVLGFDTKALKRGERDLDAVGVKARRAAKDVDTSSAGMARSFKRVATAAAGLFAINASIGNLLSVNAQFGASIQRVAAISGATAGQLDQLREAAIRMGAQTQFSASQAADGLTFLAQAGFSANEAVEALPNVLALAAASGLELATAADIASNVLSGFNKEVAEAGTVSDVLAAAASSTNTNVGQLGSAMSKVAPIAASLNISLEETAAAIGVMSDAGIQGERAGTALRGVLASLAGPTSQAQAALARYGLTAADIDPQTVGLAEAMSRLGEAGLTTADAMLLFGREAASGALVVAGATDRVRELTGSFEDAEGAAAEMAATMRDNLRGDLNELNSAFEGLIINIGDNGATGGFRTLSQVATESIRAISRNLSTLTTIVSAAAAGFVSYRLVLLAGSAATVLFSGNLGIMAAAVATTTVRVGALAGAQVAFSTATVFATTVMKSLLAVMVANPFLAVATAVGVLAASFIGLAQSQANARAETVNLLRSLKSLAQARSADFAGKRNEAQQRRNAAQDRVTQLELELQRSRPFPELLSQGTGRSRVKALEEELRDARWELIELDGALKSADNAYKGAETSAAAMAMPVAEGAKAVSSVGAELGKVSKGLKGASSDFDEFGTRMAALVDRLFPQAAKIRRLREEFEDLGKASLSATTLAQARGRLIREAFGDAQVKAAGAGPLISASEVSDNIKVVAAELGFLAGKTQNQTVKIAESFKDMAQKTVSALSDMVNSIKGGGFLDVLGSAVNLLLQLGGVGVFGGTIANRINSAPSFNGGGYTGANPRSGGLDGQGGFLAMLHPQETVVDHTRGQMMPQGQAQRVQVEIVDTTGLFETRVNGQIAANASGLINGSVNETQSRLAYRQSRRVG